MVVGRSGPSEERRGLGGVPGRRGPGPRLGREVETWGAAGRRPPGLPIGRAARRSARRGPMSARRGRAEVLMLPSVGVAGMRRREQPP